MSTESKKSGLRQIFLYNSIFRGKFCKIECDFHTNNIGDNGAGKTCLLSLIPFFYGEDPRNLVSREAGKLPFVQWYLPQSSSFIAFDYLHLNEPKTVIFYNHKGSLTCRFIDADASDTFSKIEVIDALKASGEVDRWLNTSFEREKLSVQIKNQTEYRAIIQNDPVYLRRNRQGADLAYRFSLGSGDDRLRHIHALTSVMLSDRSNVLNRLKNMLIDCYVAPKCSAFTIPSSSHSHEMLNTLRSMISLNKESDRLHQAINLKDRLLGVYEKIYCCKHALTDLVALNTQKLKSQEENIASLKDRFDKRTDEYKNTKRDLDGRIFDLKTVIEKLSAQIENTQKEYDEYEQMNINDIKNRYDNREQYHRRYLDLKQHYTDLEDKLKEERPAYEAELVEYSTKKSELSDRQREEIKKAQIKLDKALDELNLAKEEVQRRVKNFDDTFLKSENSINEKAALKRDEILKDIDRCYEVLDKVMLLTPEEEAAQTLLKDKEAQLSRELDEQNAELSSKMQEFTDLIESEHQKENEAKALFENKNRLDELCSKTEQNLLKYERSLQCFLEHSRKDWQDDIGAVINHDLLMEDAQTLKAQMIDSSSSVYGLSLDLEHVKSSKSFLSYESLEESLSLKKDELSKASRAYDSALGQLNELRAQKDKFQSSISKIKSDIQNTRKDIENTSLSLKELQSDILNCQTQKRESLRIQISEFKKQLVALENSRLKLISDLNDRKKGRLFDLKADNERYLEGYSTAFEAKKDLIQTIAQRYDRQRADLDKAHRDFITSQSFDMQQLERARQDRDSANSEYQDILKTSDLIAKYDVFYNSQYKGQEERKNRVNDLLTEQSSVNKDLGDLKVSFEADKEQFNHEHNLLSQQIKELNARIKDHLDFVQNNSASLSEIEAMVESNGLKSNIKDDISALNEKQLIKTIKEAQEHSFSCISEIKGSIEQVSALLTKSSGSKIAKYWDDLISRQCTGITLYSNSYYLMCTDILKDLLDTFIPAEKTMLVQSVFVASMSYQHLYEQFTNFKDLIGRVSNEFARRLNLSNPFTALSDLKVELVSKLDDFSLWNELKLFNASFESQKDKLSKDTLPSEEFTNEFEHLSSLLADSRICEDLSSIIELCISLKENGREVFIRSNSDLQSTSSRGVSRLAVLVLFCALTRNLVANESISILWPLDELGEFSEENIIRIFDLMDENNITLFSAQPNLSATLEQRFIIKNYVDRINGVVTCGVESTVEDNPLLALALQIKAEV